MEECDEGFVFKRLPDYLRCIVCHLVLRQPLQIMRCGHRFCQQCFNRIKKHCESHGSQLLCPIDRIPIDISKVFEDTGIDRVIGDLLLRCGNSIDGNRETGEVSCLHKEAAECDYTNTDPVSEMRKSLLLEELSQRMLNCERSLLEKEKDIAMLKLNLEKVKKSYSGKLKEVDALKHENQLILLELDKVKEENRQMDILNSRVEALERREISPRDELVPSESRLAINLVIEADDEDNISTVTESDYNDLPPAYQHCTFSSAYGAVENGETVNRGDGRRLFCSTDRRNSNTKSLNSIEEYNEVNGLYSSCSTHGTENLNRAVGYDRLNHFNTNGCNIDQNLLTDCVRKILDLKDHVSNIENIFFCETSGSKSKEILFQWVVQNYSDYFEKGDPVYSPIFFTEIKGYCFRLKIGWTGDQKEHLAVGLHLCRGRLSERELEPFDLQYSIEMQDKDGNVFAEKIPLADVEEYRVESFSIFPGENCAQRACGNAKFLSKPKLDNYVINDRLYVKCRVILQNKVSPLKRPVRMFKNRYF